MVTEQTLTRYHYNPCYDPFDKQQLHQSMVYSYSSYPKVGAATEYSCCIAIERLNNNMNILPRIEVQ